MTVFLENLTTQEIEGALKGQGLGLELHGFRCVVSSDTGLLAAKIHQLYAGYQASLSPEGFYDFRISVDRVRRPFRSTEVEFFWEGTSPFPPLPFEQTHPLFEWGLNWCIATASGCDIVVHSAVIERNGKALVLPGHPGSGKSTLCADLALGKFRLLSDELTIIDPHDRHVRPFPRPISLKNNSIDLIAKRHPSALVTKRITDTRKGDIAYVPPPSASLVAPSAVPIGWIVFPQYSANSRTEITPITRANAFARLLENAFNVDLIGQTGYIAFAESIAQAECFDLRYSDLDEVSLWLDELCR